MAPAVFALLLLLAGPARGQERVPAGPADPAPEAMPEQPAEPEPAAPEPAGSVEVFFSPAYQDLDLTGRGADFFHYHTRPSGLYVHLLKAIRRDREGVPLQEVWWRNVGEADQKGFVDLHLRSVPSYFRLWRDTAGFYGDPQYPGRLFSRRANYRMTGHLQSAATGPTLDLRFWDQELSIPSILRFQKEGGIRYHASELSALGQLPLAGGRLYFEPRFLFYDAGSPASRDSGTTILTGEYTHSLGRRADLGAAFDHIATRIAGEEAARWNIWRLEGSARPVSRLFVDAFYRAQEVDLPFSETTWLRSSRRAGVNVSAYPARHVSLRGGLFREDLERFDTVDRFTDEPTWKGGWLALRASNPGVWTLNARYRDRGLADAPPATIANLNRQDTLYYTRDRSLTARLDAFPIHQVNAYLSYGWLQRANEERHTRISLATTTFGASTQLTQRLSLTAEASHQLWDGRKGPYRNTLPFPPFPGPTQPARLFWSNGHLVDTSLSYQVDRRSSLDLSGFLFKGTGGQKDRETTAIIQFRRSVSPDFFYSVGYEYDHFNDRHLKHRFTAFPLLLQVGFRRQFR